ncbi:hypothetical protein GALL_469500 [mine drainage metagenome]|uniref:Uncharacterized protein n=1 Tax=mine drainage metagenome TaxID=410659 RepID=A0A1J5PIU7_9ZZZZ
MRDKVTKERGARREFGVVDIAVQRLVHPKNEFRHDKDPTQRLVRIACVHAAQK